MRSNQRRCLLAGAAVLAAMWLFPPCFFPHYRDGTGRGPTGYHFLFYTSHSESPRIDFERLFAQSIVVSVITAAAFMAFRSTHRLAWNEGRSASQPPVPEILEAVQHAPPSPCTPSATGKARGGATELRAPAINPTGPLVVSTYFDRATGEVEHTLVLPAESTVESLIKMNNRLGEKISHIPEAERMTMQRQIADELQKRITKSQAALDHWNRVAG